MNRFCLFPFPERAHVSLEEMNEAGYRLKEDLDFLPEQFFTIFSLHKQDKRKKGD
jgi:hypothetical protein